MIINIPTLEPRRAKRSELIGNNTTSCGVFYLNQIPNANAINIFNSCCCPLYSQLLHTRRQEDMSRIKQTIINEWTSLSAVKSSFSGGHIILLLLYVSNVYYKIEFQITGCCIAGKVSNTEIYL